MSAECGDCGAFCDADDKQDGDGQVYCVECWRSYTGCCCTGCGFVRDDRNPLLACEGQLLCEKCWCSVEQQGGIAFKNACARVVRAQESVQLQALAHMAANAGVPSVPKKSARTRTIHSPPPPRKQPPRSAKQLSTTSSNDAQGDRRGEDEGSEDDVSSKTSASSELSSDEHEEEHNESSGSKSKQNSTVNPGRRIETKAKFIRDTADGLGREAYDLHRYPPMC